MEARDGLSKATFFAVGFAIAFLAAWIIFKQRKPDDSIERFYKNEIERLNREGRQLESRQRVWTEIVQKYNDSLRYEKRKSKVIYEKYIRLRSRRLPIFTDSKLDSAINRLIGQL